ncbi:MAG TPA: CocE/NonD family hydrolase [Actinomycetota bacterium]|nr:CocE/NonD family hydrolase [Actinomycetota bacterium]
MRRFRFLLASLSVAAWVAVPALADDPGYTKIDAMVPVASDVRLDTKIYVPTATAPTDGWPLIVRHHGGGSNKDNDYDTKYALAAIPRGFAVAMYSVRGHGNSEGSFDFFGPESVSDFSVVLDWIDTNVSSIDTNNVGASGISQGGGMSLLPAALDPQGRIKAVAVGNTFDSLNHALNPNDCFKFSFATGIFAAAYKSAGARTDDELAVRWGATWYTDTEDTTLPPWAGPFPPPSLPYLFNSTTNEAAGRSPLSYVSNLIERQIPVFWSNSWEDQLFPGDHPEKILAPLSDAGIPVHYWFASGGHAAGPNDPADEAGKEAAMLDWFDEFLRGVPHGYASGVRPVVDFAQRVPDGSGWSHKQASSWPPPSAPSTFYSQADGSLGSTPGESNVGVIANDGANANIANDPIVAGEVPGRIPFSQVGTGIKGLPEEGTPVDTASFVSGPLANTLEVTGSPRVEVEVSKSTAQTVLQINSKVWDIAPDGTAAMINRGCTSGPPPTDGKISLDLWPNSHIFKAGHRIRLDISTVDFPTFEADKEPSVSFLGPITRVTLPIAASV